MKTIIAIYSIDPRDRMIVAKLGEMDGISEFGEWNVADHELQCGYEILLKIEPSEYGDENEKK